MKPRVCEIQRVALLQAIRSMAIKDERDFNDIYQESVMRNQETTAKREARDVGEIK